MLSVGADVLLAINMVGNSLRAIEAEKSENRLTIRSVSELTMEAPFDLKRTQDPENIPVYAAAINRLVDEKSIRSKSACLAIDRRMILHKKLKVDRDLGMSQVKAQIEWEVEQLLISPRDEYNIAFERMGVIGNQYETYLVAAIRKDLISYLNDVFVRTPLALQAVDMDILAAVRGLYGYGTTRTDLLSALVDFTNTGIDVIIMKEGKYAFAAELPAYQEGSAEEIARLVSRELDRLVESHKDELITTSYESIYLAGDKADVEIIPHLQGLQDTADIRFADPFENFQLSIEAETNPLIKNKPEKFLMTAGMVLL